ncbi:hypothetical protein SERLA73DRAFT_138123, partial [Serpula lacrymans var. lacrymans S7.3]
YDRAEDALNALGYDCKTRRLDGNFFSVGTTSFEKYICSCKDERKNQQGGTWIQDIPTVLPSRTAKSEASQSQIQTVETGEEAMRRQKSEEDERRMESMTEVEIA